MQQKETQLPAMVDEYDSKIGLTSTQEKCAMILASGASISEVARDMDLSRGTLYRWMGQVAFKCYLNYLKQEMKNSVEANLMKMQAKAMKAMSDSLDSENESIKLKASMWVLKRLTEVEVGETDVRLAVRSKVERGDMESVIDKRCDKKMEEMGLDL